MRWPPSLGVRSSSGRLPGGEVSWVYSHRASAACGSQNRGGLVTTRSRMRDGAAPDLSGVVAGAPDTTEWCFPQTVTGDEHLTSNELEGHSVLEQRDRR